MKHVSSARPTGKFPEKVENLKKWGRFPGWNGMSCSIYVSRSLYQFQVHGRAPRRTGVYDQMEQLFTNRKFHFCSHGNFRVFFLNGKRPKCRVDVSQRKYRMAKPTLGTWTNHAKCRGDNDRRSKRFCLSAVLYESFTWKIVKTRELRLRVIERFRTWRQGGYIGVPNQSRGSWTFFFVNAFLCSNKFA